MVTQLPQVSLNSPSFRPRFRTGLRPLVAALMLALWRGAFALPTDPTVVAGHAVVNAAGTNSLVINQSSAKAAIDWRSFSIGANEAVRFNQPSASAMTVNRVTANDPSRILGSISAPGTVFLINPSGIIFGRTAVVDVGSLVASTLTASTADLLNGRNVFTAAPGGSGTVRNEGRISAAPGGSVSLIGTQVDNSGTILTPGGTTGLVAGERVSVDFDGDGLVRYQVDAAAARALVTHSGEIVADGGRVALQASARDALMDTVLNVEGVVRARGLSVRNGEIYLDGGRSGTTQVSGTLDVSGRSAGAAGGQVRVLGENVGLFDQARIDASGATGGGTVLIGGNFQGKGPEHNAMRSFVGSGVSISADALGSGDGGKVITWADDWTRFYGSISARGGEQSGNGGFVEVSGKGRLGFAGDVVTSAPKGRSGTLLLDPSDLYVGQNPNPPVVEKTGPTIFFADDPGDANFYVAASRFTGNSEYFLSATHDVIFNANVNFGSAGGNTVHVTATSAITSSGFNITTAGGGLSLTANTLALGNINTAGGALTIANTGNATLSGVVAGAGSLVKNGAGKLTLSNANTYGGATNINAGILSVKAPDAIKANTDVTVAANATLDIDASAGAFTFNSVNLNVEGGGSAGQGALTGTGLATYAGPVNLTFDTSMGGTGTLTLNGAVQENGGNWRLIKVGSGTLVLGGANSYHGGTEIDAGILSVKAAEALLMGTNVWVTNGGTLDINASAGAFTLNPLLLEIAGTGSAGQGALTGTGAASYAGTVTMVGNASVGGTGTLALSGPVEESAGSWKLTKVGSGTLALSSTNTYSGGTDINAGILSVKAADALLAGSNVRVGNGGTLDIDASAGAFTLNPVTLAIGGVGSAGQGALTGTGAASYAGPVTLNADTRIGGTGTLTLNGALHESGGSWKMIKVGTGTLALGDNASDYSGGTHVSQGRLSMGVASALPGLGELRLFDGALLELNDNAQSVGPLFGSGGSIALGTAALTVTTPSGITGDFSGTIGGSGSLIKEGLGTQILSGGNTTYSGVTVVNAGTLTAASSNALGVGNVVVGTGSTLGIADVALTGPGTINLAGTLLGAGSNAAYDGIVALAASAAIDVAAGGRLTLTPTSSVTGVSVVKNGLGTLDLRGSGSYTGGTTINAGSLQVNKGDALGTGNVAVTTAGTLEIAGVPLTGPGTINLAGTLLGSGSNAAYDGVVALAATGKVNVASGGTLKLTSSLTGASLVKDGLGVLDLSGSGSFTGGTLLNAGTLSVSHGAALGTGDVAVAANTTLNIANVLLTGPGRINLAGTLSGSGSNAAYGGTVTLFGTADVNAGVGNVLTLTSSSTLEGASLRKEGAGTLALAGTNIYTGATLVNAGTLSLDSALPDIPVTLSGGTEGAPTTLKLNSTTQNVGTLSGTGSFLSVDLGTGNLNVTAGADREFAGVISGSGNFAKDGPATLTLSGANTYSGSTYVSGGVLRLSSANALSTASRLQVFDGGTVELAGITLNPLSSLSLSGEGAGLVGALRGTGTAAAYAGEVTLTGNTVIGVGGTTVLTLGGEVKDSGSGWSLSKIGTGSLDLRARGFYGGGTTVKAGTLTASHGGALGTGDVTVEAPAVLILPDVQLTGPGDLNLAGTLRATGSNATYGGTLALAGGEIDVGTGDKLTLTSTSSVTGTSLVKNGAGTLDLKGTGTYGGGTMLNAGTLVVGNGSALGLGDVTVASLTTLNIANVLLAGPGNLHLAGTLSGTGSSAAYRGVVRLDGSNARLVAATALDALKLHSGLVGAGRSLTLDGLGLITLAGGASGLATLTQNSGNQLNPGAGQSIVSTGAQTYLGVLTGSGGTLLNSTGGAAITADNPGNALGGMLAVDTSGPVALTGHFGALNIDHAATLRFGTLAVDGVTTVAGVGSVTQTSPSVLTLNGSTSLTAGSVRLTNHDNDFAGVVTVATSGASELYDSNDLHVIGTASSFGATAVGALGSSVITTVGDSILTAGGDLGSHGSVAGNARLTSTGGAITHDANVAQTLTTSAPGSTTLSGTFGALDVLSASVLSLGPTEITGYAGNTGSASIVASGSVSQTGALTVKDRLTITAGSTEPSVSLNNAANRIGGALNIETTERVELAGHFGATARLRAGELDFGTTTVTGTTDVVATGGITQSGPLTLGAAASLGAGQRAIRLSDIGNDFSGVVTLATTGLATLHDSNSLALAGSVGSLAATAGTTLHSAVATTVGDSSLTAGGDITHDGASVTGTLLTDTAQKTTLSGHFGALDVTQSGALVFGSTTVDGVATVRASGPISQTGTSVLSFTDTAQLAASAITLTNTGNDFSKLLTVTSTGPTEVYDANSLSVTGIVGSFAATAGTTLFSSVTTTAGDSHLKAGTAITHDSGRVAGVLLTETPGSTTLSGQFGALHVKASGELVLGAVTVDGATTVDGTHSVVINASGPTTFGPTTVSGDADIRSAGAVSQTGALKVTGATTVATGQNAVTLGDDGNDFSGLVTVTAGPVSLHDSNDLNVALNSGVTSLKAGGALTASGTAASLAAVAGTTLDSSVETSGHLRLEAGSGLNSHGKVGGDAELVSAGAITHAADVAGLLSTRTPGRTTLSGHFGALDVKSGALDFGATDVDGNVLVNAGDSITQSGALRVEGISEINATFDATGQAVTLSNSGNYFASGLSAKLNLGSSAEPSNITSARALALGTLDITGTGTVEFASLANMNPVVVPKVLVPTPYSISVQNATGSAEHLSIYAPSIYQQDGTLITTGPAVTLKLNAAGSGSINLTAGAQANGSAGLPSLISTFSKAGDAPRTLTRAGANLTNRIDGQIAAFTRPDEGQASPVKTVVAIASDAITMDGSKPVAIDADTVMLIARAVNGGGGTIQTHVAATSMSDGRNITTGPTLPENKNYSILPSIFVVTETGVPASGTPSAYRFGSGDKPIAVSFGAVDSPVNNSRLQTIAVDPYKKDGGSGGVPVFLATQGLGVNPVGPIRRFLVFPINTSLSAIRAVVVDGVQIMDSSAYDSVQSNVAEVLNQVRKEQLESGFSNENVSAQLRKGVITETRVGQAAVDRFQGVAPVAGCVGTVVGDMVVCAPAAGPGRP